MRTFKRIAVAGVVGTLVASMPAAVMAQGAADYPNRTIKIISPFAPGGITDTFSRLIGAKLQQKWGHPVVVENRPGAGGNIGADAVAKSPADGYTIVLGNVGTHAINQFVMKKMPFDAARDFAPIALVVESDGLLAVNNDLPAKTLPELIALAKTSKLSIATAGIGSPSHLAGEMFKQRVGADIAIVHYRGAVPSLTDVVSGVVSMSFATMQTALPLAQGDKIRSIAIFSAARSAALPNLPTMAEAGLPGFAVNNWIALFAPAGTPPAIIAKLNAEINAIMETPEMQERLKKEGARFTRYTPEEFAAFLKKEREVWESVVKASGVSID